MGYGMYMEYMVNMVCMGYMIPHIHYIDNGLYSGLYSVSGVYIVQYVVYVENMRYREYMVYMGYMVYMRYMVYIGFIWGISYTVI